MTMLYYPLLWIDISEGIDTNKASGSKECDIGHYWYFYDKGFRFQPDVCNGFRDVLMMSINLSDIAILNIRIMIIVVLLTGLAKMTRQIYCKCWFDLGERSIVKSYKNLSSHITWAKNL